MKKKNKPFGYWVKRYEKRCGTLKLSGREELFYVPDKGFALWFISPDKTTLFITAMCGDGHFWRDVGVNLLARAHVDYGVSSMRFVTRRNPAAYIRFLGIHGLYLEKTKQVGGRALYWLRVDVENKEAENNG